jgi:CheY-like chemotaxis protein
MALVMQIRLAQQGCEVSVAGSVGEAISRLDEPWDLVISDLGLPDGSGLDVARRLAQQPTPPVAVALSGYGSPQDQAESHRAGFERHLVKPVSFEAILEIVESLDQP